VTNPNDNKNKNTGVILLAVGLGCVVLCGGMGV